MSDSNGYGSQKPQTDREKMYFKNLALRKEQLSKDRERRRKIVKDKQVAKARHNKLVAFAKKTNIAALFSSLGNERAKIIIREAFSDNLTQKELFTITVMSAGPEGFSMELLKKWGL